MLREATEEILIVTKASKSCHVEAASSLLGCHRRQTYFDSQTSNCGKHKWSASYAAAPSLTSVIQNKKTGRDGIIK
jgi:hypothetical protein